MSNAAALGKLVAFRANLRRLAGVPSRVARRAAPRITVIIRLNTSAGLDAYGKPFAPLAPSTLARGRHPPPMVDTGRSLAETRARPLSGAGITIEIGGAYVYHVSSYKTRPVRSVVPERAGLPASWNAALKLSSDQEFRTIFPGVR